MPRTKKTEAERGDPLTPGHAAYFSPLSTHDPCANRTTGLVRIVDFVDDDPTDPLMFIRNVDNGHECLAFKSELEEPY